jgi:hypothetical protein
MVHYKGFGRSDQGVIEVLFSHLLGEAVKNQENPQTR